MDSGRLLRINCRDASLFTSCGILLELLILGAKSAEEEPAIAWFRRTTRIWSPQKMTHHIAVNKAPDYAQERVGRKWAGKRRPGGRRSRAFDKALAHPPTRQCLRHRCQFSKLTDGSGRNDKNAISRTAEAAMFVNLNWDACRSQGMLWGLWPHNANRPCRGNRMHAISIYASRGSKRQKIT